MPAAAISVGFEYLPTLKALLAIDRKQAGKPLNSLQPALPHELAVPAVDFNFFLGGLYSAYVRGQAYLAIHKSEEATMEFQKIIDHRGLVAGRSNWGARSSAVGRSARDLGRQN